MNEPSRRKKGKKKINKVTTSQVPLGFGKNAKNITITPNTQSRSSQQEIINQAIKFHIQGNLSVAGKYYEQCINQGFNDPIVFSNYGSILKRIGKLKEAEVYTRKAIEIKPDFADAYSNLGLILRDLGKLVEAKLYTKKAIEINPNYADALSNLGSILNDLGNLEEAELYTRKAIKIKPNLANAHCNLGTILKSFRQLKEAEQSYRKALEIQPGLANANSNLGIILRDLGKLKEAELYTRKAIKIKPNSADYHFNLGIILRDLGNLKEAKASYSKSIEIKPNWRTYFFYSGCLYQNKEFKAVKDNLDKAKLLVKSESTKAFINAALTANSLSKNKLIGSQDINNYQDIDLVKEKKYDKLILNRPKEENLLKYLYSLKNRKLNNTKDARYGKGFCSESLDFFNDNSPIISNLSKNLKGFCKSHMGIKEMMICESFFNIFTAGSGAEPHSHIGEKDNFFGLARNKYSLIYYLDIGDQTGTDPGILKLYEPYEEILPTNNMLVIIGADRKHSVSYHGNKDRVIISANFYGF